MKLFLKSAIGLFLLVIQLSVVAQKKDSLKLVCPLTNAIEPPAEKPAYNIGVEQPKIILMSSTDTVVKACTQGTVTTILRNEDGKWEVMFNSSDYYFYYSGITKLKVARGQKVKSGDMLGIIKPGEKIELMVYDFETPVDPRKYLDCGKE